MATKNKPEPQDRAFLCVNCNGGYCKIIHHQINNGFASEFHCSKCKYFKEAKK